MKIDFAQWQQKAINSVDETLQQLLPAADVHPRQIHEAMRYAVFAGGKRVRPLLCLAACQCCGSDYQISLPLAASLEMMHTYSLVHDDLPAMDNDELRRGRATVHIKYGEACAILTGDALLNQAYQVLLSATENNHYGIGDYLAVLSNAGSSKQLIGGQIMDLLSEGKSLNLEELQYIHRSKTAALIAAATELGALAAGATSKQRQAMQDFGLALGIAFQIIDDILDETQTSNVLGKTAGKDIALAKATYPQLMGLDASRQQAKEWTERAIHALDIFTAEQRQVAIALAEKMLHRNY